MESKSRAFVLICFFAPGSLAPPILKADDNMDLILATHWIYPAKVPVLQTEDFKCVSDAVKRAADEGTKVSINVR